MYLLPRTGALRLASRSCRLYYEPLPCIGHRRHYAAATEASEASEAPEAPWLTKPRKMLSQSVRRRQKLGNTERQSLVDTMETTSDGIIFGPPQSDTRILFEHLAIRDMCRCSRCVDETTKQRHFRFADIPRDILGQYHKRDNQLLEVRWTNDIPGFDAGHTSVFSFDELFDERSRLSRQRSHLNRFDTRPWDAEKLTHQRKWLEFTWEDFLRKKENRTRAVDQLLRFGLIFIRDVPPKKDSVTKIVKRFGPIRNTFYGESWDVRSVPGAKNVAYTARDLGFHQDLLYMANPPGLQALHMIKASSTGGESLFVDGVRAVTQLLMKAPQHRNPLFTFPVTYRYRNAGEWYEYSRPTLEGGDGYRGAPMTGAIDFRMGIGYTDSYNYINWSPPFQGPFAFNRGIEKPSNQPGEGLSESPLQKYRDAAEALQREFDDPAAIYETAMEPGTCVVFNNRRILHARKAFPVGGEEGTEERWLRGAYADLDPLMSRFRVAHSPKDLALEAEQKPRSSGKAGFQPRKTLWRSFKFEPDSPDGGLPSKSTDSEPQDSKPVGSGQQDSVNI